MVCGACMCAYDGRKSENKPSPMQARKMGRFRIIYLLCLFLLSSSSSSVPSATGKEWQEFVYFTCEEKIRQPIFLF